MHSSGFAKQVGKLEDFFGKLTRRLIPTKSICFAKHMFCHASGTIRAGTRMVCHGTEIRPSVTGF
jgi:hypothetical protein